MKKVTLKEAKNAMKKLKINPEVIDIKYFRDAMQTEKEHGYENMITNISDDNNLITAKIALAHLIEFPDYYIYLKKMEDAAKKAWSGKWKPNIFL